MEELFICFGVEFVEVFVFGSLKDEIVGGGDVAVRGAEGY